MTDFTIQHNVTMRYLQSFSWSVAGKTVVDVGGGDGFAALHFADSGAEKVTLVEPMIGVVMQEVEDHLRIIHVPSIQDVQQNRDIVWCHHVLEHVEDSIDFLRTMRRMLRPEGWLWLAVPNMAQHAIFSPGHIHNFMAPQLTEQLRLAHFDTENIRIWVEHGQLRMRIQPYNGSGSPGYPEPMDQSLQDTGRCPSSVLESWRWKE